MRGRPRKTPANEVQTRQTKRLVRDAQSAAVKAAGHWGAETADGAQPGADVARDEADVAETAQMERPDAETATASEAPAAPTLDTDAALALKRLRERPLCCCGCGQVLSNPKRHFIQGHDGKAKVIVRKIMRGELKPQDAPPQLTLGHSEIKFIMRSPEFRRVAEMWREICGLTLGRAAGN